MDADSAVITQPMKTTHALLAGMVVLAAVLMVKPAPPSENTRRLPMHREFLRSLVANTPPPELKSKFHLPQSATPEQVRAAVAKNISDLTKTMQVVEFENHWTQDELSAARRRFVQQKKSRH